MNQLCRILFVLTLLAFAGLLTGCELLHELKPHRLHHMNRGKGMRPPEDVYSKSDETLLRMESSIKC
ncbi:hypothetical protein MNBD_PLANCTO02-1791 [hydrothermal vent metagenome]|uniref:Lipoprotein n=1 Tax=hydrothermal vent metagenome TaxID=652676 RepID=A0A3B1DUC4_9ZZZZ